MLFLGRSVKEMDGVDLPPKPKGWGKDRMDIREFSVRVVTMSATTYELDVIYNIDVKIPIPQWLMNFGMKNLSSVLLYALSEEAEKSAADPCKGPYAVRIRNRPLYARFVGPRVMAHFNTRNWPMIRVPALEIDLADCHSETEVAAVQLWKAFLAEKS